MTHFLRFAALMIVTINMAFAQDDNTVIKKMNSDWLQSYVKRDTAALSQILSEDFVMIAPKGNKMFKQDILKDVAASAQQMISVKTDSLDLQVFNNVGLLTAYTSFVLKDKEKILNGKNCYSDVYVKRNGKWVAISAHVTLLELR